MSIVRPRVRVHRRRRASHHLCDLAFAVAKARKYSNSLFEHFAQVAYYRWIQLQTRCQYTIPAKLASAMAKAVVLVPAAPVVGDRCGKSKATERLRLANWMFVNHNNHPQNFVMGTSTETSNQLFWCCMYTIAYIGSEFAHRS
jgi:hypothetical protein